MVKIGEIQWKEPGPIKYSVGQDGLMNEDEALWNACGMFKECPIIKRDIIDRAKRVLENGKHLPGDPPEEISIPMDCLDHPEVNSLPPSINVGEEYTSGVIENAHEASGKKNKRRKAAKNPDLLANIEAGEGAGEPGEEDTSEAAKKKDKAKRDARWERFRAKRDAREEAILQDNCISSDPERWNWKRLVPEVCEEPEKPRAYDPEGTGKVRYKMVTHGSF